jgi:hypothetical protein
VTKGHWNSNTFPELELPHITDYLMPSLELWYKFGHSSEEDIFFIALPFQPYQDPVNPILVSPLPP